MSCRVLWWPTPRKVCAEFNRSLPITLLCLWFSWASLVAQMVKNQPPMWVTWVRSPLEEGMATHSSILTWRTPMDRGAWRAAVHGVAKSRTQLSDSACMSVSPLSRLFSFFLYRGSNSVSPNDLAKVTQLVGGRVRTELCVCLSSTILLHTTQHTLITA